MPMFVRTRPYVKRFAPHNTTTTKLPKKEGCTFVGARRAAPRGAACGGAARGSGLPRGSWTRPGRGQARGHEAYVPYNISAVQSLGGL